MKMDAVKQEPKERVRKYFERLDRLFRKGQIPDVEQRRRFLARLRPKIRKLCMVRAFADIEELVVLQLRSKECWVSSVRRHWSHSRRRGKR
jgi:hypothetical protein